MENGPCHPLGRRLGGPRADLDTEAYLLYLAGEPLASQGHSVIEDISLSYACETKK